MTNKNKKTFICSNCGEAYSSWMGKCSQCNQWNTLEEQIIINQTNKKAGPLSVVNLSNLKDISMDRLSTRISDIDLILGGGIVNGGVILLAGQPGIGKSTLLLQIAGNISKQTDVLYVSGEESIEQVSLRAKRLNVDVSNLKLASSNSTDDIVESIKTKQYKLVIVDSIQTVSCDGIASSSGSVSQITNSTNLLTTICKSTNTSLLLIGHVTKEGSIAGPKILEHMVDVVLQFEGDRYDGYKIIRALKNRYGPTSEAGIFEMTETGLIAVNNPSEALLAERQQSDGSVVLATIEGTRPVLVEVQALVNRTSYGYPKRASSGFDLNRLNLLIAVLERRAGLQLAEMDVYINVVGGIKLQDPAADLAICMAIGSATRSLKLNNDAVIFGEVGLSGEIRHVSLIEKRINEASKLGFNTIIGPRSKKKYNNLNSVTTLRDALNKYLESPTKNL